MIALKTMFYNPSDFASMDNPASMAMTDRMNGIFAALEIPLKNLPLLMSLQLASTLRRTTRACLICPGLLPSATSKNSSQRFLYRLKKVQLAGQYLEKKAAGFFVLFSLTVAAALLRLSFH